MLEPRCTNWSLLLLLPQKQKQTKRRKMQLTHILKSWTHSCWVRHRFGFEPRSRVQDAVWTCWGHLPFFRPCLCLICLWYDAGLLICIHCLFVVLCLIVFFQVKTETKFFLSLVNVDCNEVFQQHARFSVEPDVISTVLDYFCSCLITYWNFYYKTKNFCVFRRFNGCVSFRRGLRS